MAILQDVKTVLTSLTFVHEQSAPLPTWNIYHGLGRNPSVTIVDSAGSVVIGNVRYVDVNTVEVTFNGSFSGKAYLN